MIKNKYLTLKKQHEKEINDFPLFFAFNDEQFKEGLKKLNTTKENLRSIMGGGFIKKEDVKKWQNLHLKQYNEHKNNFKNEKYVYDMFRYELGNHEFIITYDETETLGSLNLTFNELNKNKFLLVLFEKAKKDYLKDADTWN